MDHSKPEPCLFVIFGGTGDLARRKLLPAMARLAATDQLGVCHIVGVTPDTHLDDVAYRKMVRDAMGTAGGSRDAFPAERIHFQTIGRGSPEDFAALGRRLQSIEREHGLGEHRAFYLALPTSVLPSVLSGLGEAELNRSAGWTRIVVEKPFGYDLQSATELDHLAHRWFDEKQIYRIDHYLGKETVQNLLVFRFANAIFESLWNRDRIRSVEILVAEELGTGGRAAYYDKSGALRDMVQNHLTQLLTLVAMEVPSSFNAEAIRYEKVKVLHSIAPVDPAHVIRGQYTAGTVAGNAVPGYLEEDGGILAGSSTETFVSLELGIDNWRWKGVPFRLRTGKRLTRRLTQIAVTFRDVPISLFSAMGGAALDTPDVLIITLQPDEGFSLHFDVKCPGEPLRLRRIPLEFKYGSAFGELPEAYETLLLDVLTGDQTLFVHGDEVLESWRIFMPILEDPARIHPYRAGTWGPEAAGSPVLEETAESLTRASRLPPRGPGSQ